MSRLPGQPTSDTPRRKPKAARNGARTCIRCRTASNTQAQEQTARGEAPVDNNVQVSKREELSRRDLPLLPLPPVVILWREAEHTLPPTLCFARRRAERHAVLASAVKHPHVRLVLRLLLQLPPPLLLLLLLLQLQVLGQEEGDSGAVVALQRRRHQRGAP